MVASDQQRTVLARDRALLQRRIITYGYFVRSYIPKTQAEEALRKFNLYSFVKPLARCTHYNGELIKEADKKNSQSAGTINKAALQEIPNLSIV